MMLRLLLKIHWVALRLREKVEVQCSIKSFNQSFLIPQSGLLINGKAVLNAYSQFFICDNSPQFQLNVTIIIGKNRKFAGKTYINLREWDQRCNHETQSILTDSPDSKAKIKFDFMFMESDVAQLDRRLISLPEYEGMNRFSQMKQIQLRHESLLSENNRLASQMQVLKKKNCELSQRQGKMEQEQGKNDQDHLDQIKKKDMQLFNSQANISAMSGQMEKIRDLIEDYGEKRLIEKMNDVMGYKKEDKQFE